MSVSLWRVLVRGDWGLPELQWSERKLDRFDFESMKTKIQGPLSNRFFYTKENLSCEIDGCLKGNIKDFVYLIEVDNTCKIMQVCKIAGVVGTVAMELARRWTPINKVFPDYFLASEILFGIGTLLLAFRLRQVESKIFQIFKKSVDLVLNNRLALYKAFEQPELNFPPIQSPCLLCKESEFFYSLWVLRWTQKLLDQNPQTAEERKSWVEEFFKADAPLNDKQANRLFNLNMGSKPSVLSEVRKNYQDYPKNKKYLDFEKHDYKCKKSTNEANLVNQLNGLYPEIRDAFKTFENRYQDKSASEFYCLQEYLNLAYRAAINSPELEQYYQIYEENLNLFENPAEIDYSKARHFLSQLSQFIKGELKETPQFAIVHPQLPDLSKIASKLDKDVFYERARKLKPSKGTPKAYEAFLEQIKN